MFSPLKARWGKVNSLGIWRMKEVLLWLRTKGSRIIHLRDLHWAVCRGTGCAISCFWAFWVGTFTSLCCNPNSSCILAQQTEISLLPCAIYFPNQTGTCLTTKPIKTCYQIKVLHISPLHFFFLGWKWRFLGSFSGQPAQLTRAPCWYHADQRRDCDLHSREAKDKVIKMLSTLPKLKWECGHWPPNTLLFLKKAFLYKRKWLIQSTLHSKAKHFQQFL